MKPGYSGTRIGDARPEPRANQRPKSDRFVALDAIRGFAVCGILLRNIYFFGLPSIAYNFPILTQDKRGSDFYSWVAVETLVDGSMRALFSMLFGASALLILSPIGEERVQSIDYYFRRAFLLLIIGLFHAYFLLSPIDIIFVYGLIAFLIFPLRYITARYLIYIAVIWIIIGVFLNILSDLSINAEASDSDVRAAFGESVKIVDAAISTNDFQPPTDTENLTNDEGAEMLRQLLAIEIADRLSGYFDNFLLTASDSFENHAGTLFKVHIFDVGALILLGMAFLKLGIVTGERKTSFYLAIMALGYGFGLLLNFFEVAVMLQFDDQDAVSIFDWTKITYDAGRICVAIGHMSLIILLTRWRSIIGPSGVFVSAGRLALTIYISQTLVCIGLFYGFGLGQFGEFNFGELLLIALFISACLAVGAKYYLRYFRQGPLEYLVRRLSGKPSNIEIKTLGRHKSAVARLQT